MALARSHPVRPPHLARCHPGCGLSLFALTLAACISSGSPLPDGTPTLPGNVILFAPYDSASDTLKPRLEAAGGDPARVLLFRPPLEDASRTITRTRSFALPRDLDHLANTIRRLDARLVILDPASAIPGLSRCLPALIELAHQTNCAILLTRSLSQPPADPLRSSGPASPLQEAVRSRMLLTPDPSDERHHLLLTTRHSLCAQPAILAYDILLRLMEENICTHSFPTAFVVAVSSVGASRPKPFWSYPASAGKFTSSSEPIPVTT